MSESNITGAGAGADLLPPCPFCGGGITDEREKRLSPTMNGHGALISVALRHWCDHVPGVVSAFMEIRARDRATAIAAWNRRAPQAARAAGVSPHPTPSKEGK